MKTNFERYMLVSINEVDGNQSEEIYVIAKVHLPWVDVVSRSKLAKRRRLHYTRLCALPTIKPIVEIRHWRKPGQMGGITNHVVVVGDRFVIFSTMTDAEEEAALTAIRQREAVKGGQKYAIKNEKHLNKLMVRWQEKGYAERR